MKTILMSSLLTPLLMAAPALADSDCHEAVLDVRSGSNEDLDAAAARWIVDRTVYDECVFTEGVIRKLKLSKEQKATLRANRAAYYDWLDYTSRVDITRKGAWIIQNLPLYVGGQKGTQQRRDAIEKPITTDDPELESAAEELRREQAGEVTRSKDGHASHGFVDPFSGEHVETTTTDERVVHLPQVDTMACARAVHYPKEAQELGIEGNVKLRVSLDANGKVRNVTVLSGPGHGLDEAAADALKSRCVFSPARRADGTPVPYVIPTYTWTFELPR